jgi:hypothetical protein
MALNIESHAEQNATLYSSKDAATWARDGLGEPEGAPQPATSRIRAIARVQLGLRLMARLRVAIVRRDWRV